KNDSTRRNEPKEGSDMVKPLKNPQSKVKESKVKNTSYSYSPDFERAWESYGRKGSKKMAFPYWKKLSPQQRQAAEEHIPAYVASNERQYLKDFERYLKAELWESAVVPKSPTGKAPAV